MRKVLLFVVMALLITSMMFSVTLRLTFWGSELDKKTWEERANLVSEKFPDVELKLIYVPGDYSQKVQTMIAGGDAPDIIVLAEDIHAYSSSGQIISLDQYIKKYGLDLSQYPSTLIKQYSYDGKIFGIPDRSGAMVLYYNKDYFDEAGIPYPSKSWRWSDFLNAAQKLTIRDENGEIIRYGFAAGDWWPWWMSFMYMNGGKILDEDGNPIVNTPENIEAIQFYNDLVYKYRVAPSPRDYANMGNIGPDQLFAQGKTAMEMTGFWNIGSLKNVPELNWDIAPLFGQKRNATVAFGSALTISKACKYKDVAFKVIKFLTSAQGQTPIVKNAEDAPANIKLLNSDLFLKPSWAKREINMKAFADSSDMIIELPIVPQWNEILEVFGDYLSEVFMNKLSVRKALEKIQEDLEFTLSW